MWVSFVNGSEQTSKTALQNYKVAVTWQVCSSTASLQLPFDLHVPYSLQFLLDYLSCAGSELTEKSETTRLHLKPHSQTQVLSRYPLITTTVLEMILP